jgi:hypothetical protein
MRLDNRLKKLEQRFRTLAEERTAAMEALELVSNVAHFDTSFNQMDSPVSILQETAFRCGTLLHFSGAGFYLVEEDNSDFILHYAAPDDFSACLEREVALLIDQGAFAWVLERNRPMFFQGNSMKGDFLAHPLATPSRVRGMFIGLLAGKRQEVGDIALSLLSVVLHSCAHMLESHALYALLRVHCGLEKTVREGEDSGLSPAGLLQSLQLTRSRLKEKELAQAVDQELISETLHDQPLPTVAEKVLALGMRLTDSPEGLLCLVDADLSTMRCLAAHEPRHPPGGLLRSLEAASLLPSPGEGGALLSRRTFTGMVTGTARSQAEGLLRYLCCPVASADGAPRAMLALCNASRDYGEQDVFMGERLASFFAQTLRVREKHEPENLARGAEPG